MPDGLGIGAVGPGILTFPFPPLGPEAVDVGIYDIPTVVLVNSIAWTVAEYAPVRRLRPFDPALFAVVVAPDDPPLRLPGVRRFLEELAAGRRAPFAPALFQVVAPVDDPPLRLPARAIAVAELGVPPGGRWVILPIESGPSELPEALFWRARRALEATAPVARPNRPDLTAFAAPPVADDPPLRVPRIQRPEPEPRRTIWLAPWVPVQFAPPPVTDDPPFAAWPIRRFEAERPRPLRRWPADWVVLFEPEPPVPPVVVGPSESPGGGKKKRRKPERAPALRRRGVVRDPVFRLEPEEPPPSLPVPVAPAPAVAATSAPAPLLPAPVPLELPRIELRLRSPAALPLAPPDFREAIAALLRLHRPPAVVSNPAPPSFQSPPPWLQDDEDLIVLAHLRRHPLVEA